MITDYIKKAKDFSLILDKLKIKHAVIGGVAASLWSEDRLTKDIDLTITMTFDQWSTLQTELSQIKNTEIFKTAFDSGETVPYLVRVKYQDVIIDLLTAQVPFQEEIIKRSILTETHGQKIYLASAEDIILLKLIAKRVRDLEDIRNIVQHISNLDFPYIEQWAKTWEVLDLWHQIQSENKI